MTPIEKALAKLPDAKPAGKGWSARCPAHDDRRASLTLNEGDDGRALLHCHAGCSFDAICSAAGLAVADLMPEAAKPPTATITKIKSKPRMVARYDYHDEAGVLLFQVVRLEPKDFRQRRPDGKGGWFWNIQGVRIVPYRLPELLADPGRVVLIVEGEKDADALARIGVLATTNAGGAGKWKAEHAAFLRGRRVVVLPDNDEPGRSHAQQVAASLFGLAASIRIVHLPELKSKGDVSDWLAAGGDKEQLRALANAAPEWTPDGAQPWLAIEAFDALQMPQFPTDALPECVRNWTEAESHATQTPADLAAMLALAVCAAAVARRVQVEPRPGWREPVNLVVAVLLEPGNRKSAVFSDAIKPLRDLETELIAEARPIVAREQSKRRQREARLRSLEKRAAEKGDDDARREADELATALANQEAMVLPRLIVDDATSEKLGMMLGEQQGRIASMSPEGGVFDLMAGMYSKSGIPQFSVYLMGHSGDDLITDRVSRPSVCVKRPALTCAYAMQPAVIEGLAESAAFRGRGLLARFLYAAPQSWIGQREIGTPPVPEVVREAYCNLVKQLGSTQGECVLDLEPDARSLLTDWETEIEQMLADGGQMEVMRDWGAKLAGATLRLAAVMHCIESCGTIGSVTANCMAAAIRIARYLVPHADAVLRMMLANDDATNGDARYVLRWIERHSKKVFTKSEAQHHGKRRFPKAEDIDAALAELERRHYIRLQPPELTGPGRPPSPAFEVNPAFANASSQKRSRNSRYSTITTTTATEFCGNIGSALAQLETPNGVIGDSDGLTGDGKADQNCPAWEPNPRPNAPIKDPAKPTTPVCPKCGATSYRDTPMHAGQSIRRECGRCRYMIGFPIWHGKDNTGHKGQQGVP